MRTAAALFIALLVSACGEDTCEATDTCKKTLADAQRYFALKHNQCWEYSKTTVASQPPGYGLAVENIDMSGAPKPNYQIVGRQNANATRKLLVSIQGQDLLLHSVEILGTGNQTYWVFQPAVKLASAPVTAGGRLETTTRATQTVVGTGGEEVKYDKAGSVMRVDIGSKEELATASGAKSSYRLLLQLLDPNGAMQTIDKIWLAPELGWAQVQWDADSTILSLQGTRTINPDATPSQICGWQ
jgi:hypothetical protein